jgi:hypothetical protein
LRLRAGTDGARFLLKHRPVVMALSVCMMCWSVSVGAAEPTPGTAKAEASRHFKLGVELAGDSDYKGAAVEFRRAYEIQPTFQVLYNLGQALVGANRPLEAIDALERYLRDGGAKVPSARRSEVEETLRKQQARVGTLELHVTPDTAVLRLDGQEVPHAPVRVTIGEHEVKATAEGRHSQVRSVTVAGGDRVSVELTLEAEIAAAEPPPAPLPAPPVEVAPQVVVAPPAPAPTHAGRIAGGILGGLALAAFAGGVAFGVATNGPYQEELRRDPMTYAAAKAQADGFALGANVLYATAATLAVASVLTLIFAWNR